MLCRGPLSRGRIFVFIGQIIPAAAAASSDPIWLPLTPIANSSSEVEVSSAFDRDFAPLFRAGEVDRHRLTLGGRYLPHPRILLYGHLPLNGIQPGDASIGVRADLWTHQQTQLGIGWWSTIPLASRERGGLDGDELGVTIAAHASAAMGPASVSVLLGMAIRGDPLRTASQDDRPLSWGQVRWPLGQGQLQGRLGGTWATARNPARFTAAGGGMWPITAAWTLGAEGGAGLTPAAPNWSSRVWVGWRPAFR